ncbi:MAG: tetratricopeptide repeat protein [Candidatus Binatia bacterium]
MSDKNRQHRQDLKTDKFLTLSTGAVAWGRQHQQWLTWGVAALILAVAGIGIASAYSGARARDANVDLARGMAKLEGGDFAAASTELADVSTRWTGTDVAPVAGLLAANAAIRAGEADRAIAELGKLQPGAAALPPFLQQQLVLAWGAALESKQQWLDAAAKYKDAAALTGPYTAEAILSEARTRAAGGEADRARELYRQAYDQFPELPDRDLIATKFQA